MEISYGARGFPFPHKPHAHKHASLGLAATLSIIVLTPVSTHQIYLSINKPQRAGDTLLCSTAPTWFMHPKWSNNGAPTDDSPLALLTCVKKFCCRAHIYVKWKRDEKCCVSFSFVTKREAARSTCECPWEVSRGQQRAERCSSRRDNGPNKLRVLITASDHHLGQEFFDAPTDFY